MPGLQVSAEGEQPRAVLWVGVADRGGEEGAGGVAVFGGGIGEVDVNRQAARPRLVILLVGDGFLLAWGAWP